MLKLPRPRKVTLDSGATLLHQRNPVSPTVAFGVWISRGSRDEKPSERGLSHLLEHMVFRGTGKRTALDIALDLESIGGQWDAFTGKESTCYHGKVLEEHFGTFAEILADIVLDPSFPADAFSMERRVVQEEIRSVRDTPEEVAFELFYSSLFAPDQLGYPVAGRIGDVVSCTRERLFDFHEKTYTAGNAIFAFIGNIPVEAVAREIDRLFVFSRAGTRGARRRRAVFSGRRRSSVARADWTQSHLCAGVKIPSASHPDRFPLIVFSNILGGGVSSRMFQSLREKAGLAYSVFSSASFFTDAGAFSTYFSVDPKNLEKAVGIYRQVMDELRREGVTKGELESAVSQIKASVIFGVENVESRLFRLIHSEVFYGEYQTMPRILGAIERVRARDVARVIGEYFDEEMHTYATCGPRSLKGLVPGGTVAARRRERGRG
jgi:predicted Zn-dependent peptidase